MRGLPAGGRWALRLSLQGLNIIQPDFLWCRVVLPLRMRGLDPTHARVTILSSDEVG